MYEADLKLAVEDYLTYKQNAGELMFLRLNAGDFIEVRGSTRRRVKGCPAGTADFEVIKGDIDTMLRPRCKVIFLELKSEKGKTTEAQDEFADLVRKQGANYFVIRDVEELCEKLG